MKHMRSRNAHTFRCHCVANGHPLTIQFDLATNWRETNPQRFWSNCDCYHRNTLGVSKLMSMKCVIHTDYMHWMRPLLISLSLLFWVQQNLYGVMCIYFGWTGFGTCLWDARTDICICNCAQRATIQNTNTALKTRKQNSGHRRHARVDDQHARRFSPPASPVVPSPPSERNTYTLHTHTHTLRNLTHTVQITTKARRASERHWSPHPAQPQQAPSQSRRKHKHSMNRVCVCVSVVWTAYYYWTYARLHTHLFRPPSPICDSTSHRLRLYVVAALFVHKNPHT